MQRLFCVHTCNHSWLKAPIVFLEVLAARPALPSSGPGCGPESPKTLWFKSVQCMPKEIVILILLLLKSCRECGRVSGGPVLGNKGTRGVRAAREEELEERVGQRHSVNSAETVEEHELLVVDGLQVEMAGGTQLAFRQEGVDGGELLLLAKRVGDQVEGREGGLVAGERDVHSVVSD